MYVEPNNQPSTPAPSVHSGNGGRRGRVSQSPVPDSSSPPLPEKLPPTGRGRRTHHPAEDPHDLFSNGDDFQGEEEGGETNFSDGDPEEMKNEDDDDERVGGLLLAFRLN